MKMLFLISLLAFASGSTSAAEVDKSFLRASAAFDRSLIPAVVAVREPGEGDAMEAISRLADAWQVYSGGYEDVLGEAGGWSLIRDGITRRIEMAGKFAGSNDVRMGYIMLSQVRRDIVRVRTALDIDYYVDRLVLFQVAMDSVFGDGSRSLEDQDPEVLAEALRDLADRWDAIEEVSIDADVFGFLWKDVSVLDDLLKKEGDAIERLRGAVERGASGDLDDLAGAVRTGFFYTYLTFAGVD